MPAPPWRIAGFVLGRGSAQAGVTGQERETMDVLKEMMGPLVTILVAQLVVFIVVVVVLKKMLLSDTMNAVKRMKSAEGDLAKKEESMRQKMDAHEQEILRKKAEAEEEVQRQREAGEQDIARMRERMKTEAKAEADRIISDAQLNKDKLRDQLMRETSGKAVEYAGELFKLVIGKTASDKISMAFVDELISGLEEVDGASIHIDANEAEFIASHKLDPGQKARLEKLIEEKFDIKLQIQEKVDEKLLGGLIIKLGSLEIDGSLLSRYKEGVEQIKKSV